MSDTCLNLREKALYRSCSVGPNSTLPSDQQHCGPPMGYISSSFMVELTAVGLLVGGAAPSTFHHKVSMLEGSIGILHCCRYCLRRCQLSEGRCCIPTWLST